MPIINPGTMRCRKTLLAATQAYIARVVADGGTVENLRMVDDLLRDAAKNGYSSEINGAVSARWGRKLDGHQVVKLYAIGGAAYDMAQSTLAAAPNLIPGSGMAFHGLNNGSAIRSAAYTLNQPVTLIFGGMRIHKYLTTGMLFDGNVNYATAAYMGSGNIITMSGGTTATIVNADVRGVWNAAYFLFNGASSSAKIGNSTTWTGNIGANNFGALTLASNAGGSFNTQVQYTEVVPLTAPVNGAHAGKLLAIQTLLAKYAPTSGIPPMVVCDGDSMTLGAGSTGNNTYPRQLALLLMNSGTAAVSYNVGVSSQTWAQLTTAAATKTDVFYSPIQPKNILVAWEGTNSLYYGASAATTISDMQTYCNARRSVGWKVVLPNILPRTSAGTPGAFEADRLTVNAWIAANWATIADAYVDLASITALQNSNDTTYYTDGVHMTNVGYGLVANAVYHAVAGLM